EERGDQAGDEIGKALEEVVEAHLPAVVAQQQAEVDAAEHRPHEDVQGGGAADEHADNADAQEQPVVFFDELVAFAQALDGPHDAALEGLVRNVHAGPLRQRKGSGQDAPHCHSECAACSCASTLNEVTSERLTSASALATPPSSPSVAPTPPTPRSPP